jgi:hypothetical protein
MLECYVTKLQVPSGFMSSCSKVVNQVFKSSLSVLVDNMGKLTSCTNCVVKLCLFIIKYFESSLSVVMDNMRKFTSSCTNCRTRNAMNHSIVNIYYTLMSNPSYGMTYDSIFYPFHMGLMSSDTLLQVWDLYPKYNHQPFSKTLSFLACRENKIP